MAPHKWGNYKRCSCSIYRAKWRPINEATTRDVVARFIEPKGSPINGATTRDVVARFIEPKGSPINGATTISQVIMRKIKNIRLKDYDYSSDGYYFVTICTNYGKPYLDGDNKELVDMLINKLSEEFGGVDVDSYVIMSDHIHLILILNGCNLSLGEIIRRFKAKVSKSVGIRLWQPNYYEHVIRDESALMKIREYMMNNPLERKIKFEQFYKKE